MKTVIIPSDCGDPFVVRVNNHTYKYEPGAEVSVPDEVAVVIDNYWKLQPLPRKPVDGGVFPYVSNEDNGKILKVKDGAWQTDDDEGSGGALPVLSYDLTKMGNSLLPLTSFFGTGGTSGVYLEMDITNTAAFLTETSRFFESAGDNNVAMVAFNIGTTNPLFAVAQITHYSGVGDVVETFPLLMLTGGVHNRVALRFELNASKTKVNIVATRDVLAKAD